MRGSGNSANSKLKAHTRGVKSCFMHAWLLIEFVAIQYIQEQVESSNKEGDIIVYI